MYPGKINSPITENTIAITATSTTITLMDASVLPDGPNIAVLGEEDDAETILYTGKAGNTLTGLTRGFQGIAKAWPPQTPVARRFTAYDYDALRLNLTGMLTAKNVAVNATIVSEKYAEIAYPNASYTAANTIVIAVKCVVNGVTKQLNNLSINFTATDISCVLPEAASSCTFILQAY